MSLQDIAAAMGLRVSDQQQPTPVRRRRERNASRAAVRPTAVVDMVGQDKARVMLTMRTRGALLRGAHPGHILLYGPPGLGKTTLAEIVAHETGGPLIRTVGSQLSTPLALANSLSELSPRQVSVFFVDEIHGTPRKVEELLYMAMEDQRIEVTTGRGADARVQTINLPSFILVGATTLPGWLTQPLRDRFVTQLSLEYYTSEELTQIINGAAQSKGATITPEAAQMLGERSRGTPRVALRLLANCWDYTVAMANDADAPITADSVEACLALEGIDRIGLTQDDLTLLRAICVQHRGGPIGLENLAATIGLDNRTVDGVIEPYLIRAGLLRRTRRGRAATRAAFAHLRLEAPFTVDDESNHADAAWEDRG